MTPTNRSHPASASAGNAKRAKLAAHHGKDAQETSTSSSVNNPTFHRPALSGEALKLSLHWLLAKDVGRSERVCKCWRTEIVSWIDDLWRAVAINGSSKQTVKAFESSEARASGIVDYRCLAAGLCAELPSEMEMPVVPEPEICSKDVFFVVQLKHKTSTSGKNHIMSGEQYETVAAYCSSDCEALFGNQEGLPNIKFALFQRKPFEGDNVHYGDFDAALPGAENCPIGDSENPGKITPLYLALKNAVMAGENRVYISLTLFHRGKHLRALCLYDNIPLDELHWNKQTNSVSFVGREKKANLHQGYWNRTTDVYKLIASNEFGDTARRMMLRDVIFDFVFKIECNFVPLLPAPGSPEEPQWLKKHSLHTQTTRSYEKTIYEGQFTDDDKLELEKIKSFKFRCTDMTITLNGVEDGNMFSIGQKECLLFLQGLNWKRIDESVNSGTTMPPVLFSAIHPVSYDLNISLSAFASALHLHREHAAIDLPPPTLTPEDLFLIIDLKKQPMGENASVIVASHCIDCAAWFDERVHAKSSFNVNIRAHNNLVGKALDGLFDGPFKDLFYGNVDIIDVCIHLFRKDNGGSICIFDTEKCQDRYGPYAIHNNGWYGSEGSSKGLPLIGSPGQSEFFGECLILEHEGVRCISNTLPNSKEAGKAREVMIQNQITHFDLQVHSICRPKLFQSCKSDNEAKWLATARAYGTFKYQHPDSPIPNSLQWNQADLDQISKIDFFDFQLTEMFITPLTYNAEPGYELEETNINPTDLLCYLEGLDWQMYTPPSSISNSL